MSNKTFIDNFNVFNKERGWKYEGENPFISENPRVEQALEEYARELGYGDLVDMSQELWEEAPSFDNILHLVRNCMSACKREDSEFQMQKLQEECAELLLETYREKDGRKSNVQAEAFDVAFRALAYLISSDTFEEFSTHLVAKLEKYSNTIKK
jgi:phosphoribosyl-ATP pyrophosphohydrolase